MWSRLPCLNIIICMYVSPSAHQISLHHQMPDRQCLRTGNLYMKLPFGGKQPKCTPTLPGVRSATTPRPTQTLKVNQECPLDKKKGRPNKTYIRITLPIHKHKQVYLHIHKHTNNPYFCLW